MKKLFLILLAAVLVFSSCQFDEEEIFEEIKGYDMVGNQSRDKPLLRLSTFSLRKQAGKFRFLVLTEQKL